MDTGLGMRSEINITPMIDVLLVLVIIFLLLLNRQVLFAQLAREGGQAGSKGSSIVLELKDDGGYAINTQVVAPGDLGARLREIYSPRSDKVLFIKSGPRRSYGEAIAAMDVAKGAGVEVVALVP